MDGRVLIACLLSVAGPCGAADMDLRGREVPLLACGDRDDARFGSVYFMRPSAHLPESCTPLPPLGNGWRLVDLTDSPMAQIRNLTAIYLDTASIERSGNLVTAWLLFSRPDSSRARYEDGRSAILFDEKTRRVYDCDRAWVRRDEVDLYRSFRTRPELVRSQVEDGAWTAIEPRTPGNVIVMDFPSPSADRLVFEFLCGGGRHG